MLKGQQFIAGEWGTGGGPSFAGEEPGSGRRLEPEYKEATLAQVDAAAHAAGAAASEYAAVPAGARAAFLVAIAEAIEALGDELLERVTLETALPRARVQGERARTTGQLRAFAAQLTEGSWVDARIDHGDPKRTPQPKPDLRRMLVPLGPVAVFGSSNFPLAYSVAGGDTASALAAGCPVVVKAHPAHPGTSELVARAVVSALQRCGMPAGAFAIVHGRSNEVGAALVRHPAIAAVGFTGSTQGGRALCDLAAARPAPIPVFAEMGSANPVFVLPGALKERGPAIAAMLASSSTLATGQMCTSPGLALVHAGPDADAFVHALGAALSGSAPGTMVSASIRANFEKALAEVRAVPGVQAVAGAKGQGGPAEASAVLLQTTAADFVQKPRLGDEIYGPAMVAVRCASRQDLLAAARALHGHLTATVHGTAADLREHQDLLAILRTKAGRLVCNGVPTGVEVAPAMQHGGPWPASSDARFSAVGTSSILRWARPVCFQDWPQEHLPEELRDGNPRGIFRTVDGALGHH